MNSENHKQPFTLKIYDHKLDIQKFSSNDQVLTGQQIIEKSGAFPAEEHILLHLQKDGMLEEINLRETINIDNQKESFFIFKSDRVYNFELESRRYPWGDNHISAKALRMVGNIPENHDLFLEKRSEKDLEITGDTCVNLDDSGLEKIYSKSNSVKIIINGKPKKVSASEMTFSELVELAFPNQATNPNTAYTITYKRGCDCSPEGSLVKGESVCIQDGGVFNVTATDKS